MKFVEVSERFPKLTVRLQARNNYNFHRLVFIPSLSHYFSCLFNLPFNFAVTPLKWSVYLAGLDKITLSTPIRFCSLFAGETFPIPCPYRRPWTRLSFYTDARHNRDGNDFINRLPRRLLLLLYNTVV